MKCRKCGKEFIDFFSLVCPFCGFDNNLSLFDILFGRNETPKKSAPNKGKSDIYDWDNPDNCPTANIWTTTITTISTASYSASLIKRRAERNQS